MTKISIKFTIEVNPEGFERHYKEFPEFLADSDQPSQASQGGPGPEAHGLAREAMAAWEGQDLVQPGTEYVVTIARDEYHGEDDAG